MQTLFGFDDRGRIENLRELLFIYRNTVTYFESPSVNYMAKKFGRTKDWYKKQVESLTIEINLLEAKNLKI